MEPTNAASETNERPVLVQGSDVPIVRIVGSSEDPLVCAECGISVLVEGYKSECLVGIGLQCKCGGGTRTPSLPAGETFHTQVVTLGSVGKFLIGSTIDQPVSTTLTCDQELAMDLAKTRPKPADELPLELTLEGLAALKDELDHLSGGRFAPQMKSAERAIASGQKFFGENPLAWAIQYLSTQLGSGTLHLREDTAVAIGFVNTYRHMLSRWMDTEHFSNLAQDLCSSFHHTLSLLIAASYLSDHGNKILFNPATGSGRSADLYVPISATRKLYLEVKGPKALEWPNISIPRAQIEKIVKKCLSKASGQIGRSKPGVLIVASSCILPGFFEESEKAIGATLQKHGASHPGVAAVAMVGLNELSLQAKGAVSIDFSADYKVIIRKNPHYFEDNPITV